MIYYVTLKRLGGSRVSLGSGRMSPETTRKRYKKDSENERWKREREGGKLTELRLGWGNLWFQWLSQSIAGKENEAIPNSVRERKKKEGEKEREREREKKERKEKASSSLFFFSFPLQFFQDFSKKGSQKKGIERRRRRESREREREIKRLNSASKSWKPESGISTNWRGKRRKKGGKVLQSKTYSYSQCKKRKKERIVFILIIINNMRVRFSFHNKNCTETVLFWKGSIEWKERERETAMREDRRVSLSSHRIIITIIMVVFQIHEKMKGERERKERWTQIWRRKKMLSGWGRWMMDRDDDWRVERRRWRKGMEKNGGDVNVRQWMGRWRREFLNVSFSSLVSINYLFTREKNVRLSVCECCNTVVKMSNKGNNERMRERVVGGFVSQ